MTDLIVISDEFRRFVVEDDFARYGLDVDAPAPRPRYLQIELTDLCNLACAGCVRARHASTGAHFGHVEFVRLLDAMPDLEHVSFVGAGEALIVRDFASYVTVCAKRGVRSSCNTNGLIVRRRLGALVEAGLDQLAVSVDGADDAVLGRVRSGLRVRQLTAALRDAVRLTDGTGTRLSAAVTLSVHNVASFASIVSYVAGLGIREITVESLHHWGDDKALNAESLFALDPAAVVPCLEAGLAVAVDLRIAVSMFDYRRLAGGAEEALCPWPWDALYVTRYGDVTPCCIHIEADDHNRLGNVHRDAVDEIWSGPRLDGLRADLRRGGGWSSCAGCVYRKEFGRVP